MITIFLRALVC